MFDNSETIIKDPIDPAPRLLLNLCYGTLFIVSVAAPLIDKQFITAGIGTLIFSSFVGATEYALNKSEKEEDK